MTEQLYITLNNGVDMPMLGLGTFQLTPQQAQSSCTEAIRDGYRLIDTANAYMNEKAVGRAVAASGLDRHDLFIETKLWPSFYTEEDAVDGTLARLNMDYIDLLLLHQPAGDYLAGYRLMERAYKAGKVRAIGLSDFTIPQVQEILDICEVRPVILQTEIHPYASMHELKDFLGREQMVAQAWYPLGHGDASLIALPVFSRLARKYNKTNVQIILRWHLQEGNVVIPGSKDAAHIRSNFDIFDFALTPEEMHEIDKVNRNQTYFTATPEILAGFAHWVAPVPIDEQE